MRVRSAYVLASGLVLGSFGPAAAAVAAQQPPPPPAATAIPRIEGTAVGALQGVPSRPARDPRLPPTTGTAAVRGRVIDGATGQPLARVRVRFAAREPRSTLTDADGSFMFTKLPPGMLMLNAEKAGYLSASYPERRRTMRNTMMAIADGQKIESVTIAMFRGGAIAGRVVDAYGDPVEGIQIQAISAASTRQNATFRPMVRGGSPGSNDIGEFRIPRLEPGSYYLLANPRRPEDTGPTGMGRTYYPGVPSIEQAQSITVEKGQTVAGIELQLLETPLVKVSGSVISGKGEPVSAGHISLRAGAMQWMGMIVTEGGTSIRQDGTFELSLQPGEYQLDAMPMVAGKQPGQYQSGSERGEVRLSVGSEPISNVVITTGTGATATGRVAFNGRRQPPADLRGMQVFLQEAPNTPNPGECRSMARPTVNPDGTFTAENIWGSCLVRAGGAVSGWQFEAVLHRGTDITNRPIAFQAGQQVSDLQVVFTDRVGDLSLDVSDERGAPLNEYVAIVFPVDKEKWTDTRFIRTHVASSAMDAAMAIGRAQGRFAFGTSVAFTPTGGGATMSSGPSPVQTGPGGALGAPTGSSVTRPPIVKGVLAGEYFAVAVDDMSYEDLRDPEFLSQLASLATRVSIAEGDSRSVQLRRVAVPDNSNR